MNQHGSTSLWGLLATFAATAVVITIGMLFVTGVAQRTILPRLKQRAANAVPVAVVPAADSSALLVAGSPAAPAAAPGAIDSLRALREQMQLEQEQMEQTEADLRSTISAWESQRQEADTQADGRLRDLAKIYGNMKPEAAARVMARLDDHTFERVFARIEKRQAAKILSLLDPERAAQLARRAANSSRADVS
ncbi:MAG: hypothetical protein V1774_07640 [Candidatus Eisenbacteria bacterium]